MLITTGDITNVKYGTIIQQVNCQGVMGAGVAKAIANKWPVVKREYLQYCNHREYSGYTKNSSYGMLQEVKVSDDIIVYNSFSQMFYGTGVKQTNEAMLIANINIVCKMCLENDVKHSLVYIPAKIGCGLGGGNWKLVLANISHNANLCVVTKE